MKISVIPFAQAVESNHLLNKTVVVIDVLRATSVIITALQHGASCVVPFSSPGEALTSAKQFPDGSYILCGERDAMKLEGFHLGNSPQDFVSAEMKSKIVLHTTSNGTKAIRNSYKADKIYCGAFLNAKAVADKMKNETEVVLYCAGTNGKFSLDDALCAGLIIHYLSGSIETKTDDLGLSMLKLVESTTDLTTLAANCIHAMYLINKGFERDVQFCLQQDIYSIVPQYLTESNNIIA